MIGRFLLIVGTCLVTHSAFAAGSTVRVSLGQGNVQGNKSSGGYAISANGGYVAFDSEATNLVPGDTNRLADVFVRDRTAGTTERISVSTSGVQGNGISYDAHISANGRWVAFRSQASNLVPGDTNNAEDAFVRDRQTGTTRRVSVRTGGAQANGAVIGVDISGNGRVVAFASEATNLVIGDRNAARDLFVHDRWTGTTSIVNIGPGGVQCSLGGSGGAMSADGRFVAFSSACANLIPGGTNGRFHAFVRDRQTGTNELVSRNSAEVQGNDGGTATDLSADGRFVVIGSRSTNLVAGDTNSHNDIFVRDRQLGTTHRVNRSTGGVQSNGFSGGGAISDNGRFVAFSSRATNLVGADTNALMDVFVRDRQTGVTRRISLSTNGIQGNDRSLFEGLSANGQFVVFTSEATNLVPGDTNHASDVYVRLQ